MMGLGGKSFQESIKAEVAALGHVPTLDDDVHSLFAGEFRSGTIDRETQAGNPLIEVRVIQ